MFKPRTSFLVLAVALTSSGNYLAGQDLKSPNPLDFNRDIKPILSNKCFQCHGPDSAERKGGTAGFRLDTVEGATIDLGGYQAIVPGHPENSALVKRIESTDPDEMMPPKSTGKTLSAKEIDLLKTWIKQGAKYAGHWSYVRPIRSPLPDVKGSKWPRNAIDHFILARLQSEGLQPTEEADRLAIIRRVSLDLVGLPPTLDEVDQFVNDSHPQAYERLVDRLLEKQAFGEHWAHMWLDLARYADSAGYADDPPRKIWLFRDYVIRSLNANKSFAQFTVEQIAGDLLPNPTDEQLIATAFHRNTLTNNEGGTNDEEFRNVAIVDRVNTTFAVWMGTTMSCCQCHNHKYDPISQEDFYRFFAILNNTGDADRGDESPLHSIFTDEQREMRSKLEAEKDQLRLKSTTATPELTAAASGWDESFPRNVTWKSLTPKVVKSEAGLESVVDASPEARGAVRIPKANERDTFAVEIPIEAGKLQAIRLEALPDDSLPSHGPGHGGGNFVITRIHATIAPPDNASLSGRFVRVDIPGNQKILSLAEVQVFHGADNIGLSGEASQSTTDYGGDAKRAIDGKTTGVYGENSTTHTAISDNPWWQLDLKSTQPIDKIVLWNRTDAGTVERLRGFQISVLDEKQNVVWQKRVDEHPNPNSEFALTGVRVVPLSLAIADYSQDGFAADNVLKPADPKNAKDPRKDGWAVGGQIGKPHHITLIASSPVEVPAHSTLQVSIEQNSVHANHLIGHFRLSATDEPRVAEWAKTPSDVLSILQTPKDNRTADQQTRLVNHYLKIAPALEETRQRIATIEKQVSDIKPETVPIQKELAEKDRRVTKIQHRGNFLDLGKEVAPGIPATFPPLPEGAQPTRLEMAKWLVSRDNPLTPRVIANRYWEQIFGIGIVSTSEEFGSQGDLPVHPELLDWLAVELQESNWDMKAFVRLLVTSATYRQSSKVSSDLQQRDPDNRLLGRGPRFRLSAEMIRDQALFVSGLLSSKMYGPPVKPPQPSLGISAAFGSGIDWQTSAGADKFRRGIYTTWRRSNPYPSMATFDAPNREVCTLRRVRTNTPLQALVTLNDPVYLEAAQALARKIVAQSNSSVDQKIVYGFRLCLARPPYQHEQDRLNLLYSDLLKRFESDVEAATKLATDPLGPVPADVKANELAAWTVLSNVLLNLDETLMKR